MFLYNIAEKTHTQLDTGDVSVWRAGPFISENNQYINFNAPGDVPGQIYDRGLDDVYPFGLTAECIDSDGDGWGFNEYLEESCNVEQTTESACDYRAADLYGGWGWNATTSESCAPQVAAQCIDTDGDGFGWNGVATCIPNGGESQPVIDQSVVCIDSGEDGFGWTGTQSCRFDEQGSIIIL